MSKLDPKRKKLYAQGAKQLREKYRGSSKLEVMVKTNEVHHEDYDSVRSRLLGNPSNAMKFCGLLNQRVIDAMKQQIKALILGLNCHDIAKRLEELRLEV